MVIKPYMGSLIILRKGYMLQGWLMDAGRLPAHKGKWNWELYFQVQNLYCRLNKRHMKIATILWVDDEIESLQSQKLFLENKGYQVHTLTNGFDAIDFVKEN